MIKPDESYRNFMVRLDTSHRQLVEHGITLSEEVQGWFLMRQLGLDQPSDSHEARRLRGRWIRSRAELARFGPLLVNCTGLSCTDFSKPRGGALPKFAGKTAATFWKCPGQEDQSWIQGCSQRAEQRADGRRVAATRVMKGRIDFIKSKTRCHICKQLGHWRRETSTTNDVRYTGVLSFDEYQDLKPIAEVMVAERQDEQRARASGLMENQRRRQEGVANPPEVQDGHVCARGCPRMPGGCEPAAAGASRCTTWAARPR